MLMNLAMLLLLLPALVTGSFPVKQCPQGWRLAAKQSVFSSATISVGTYPNYGVTYLAGTTDGSSIEVNCAMFMSYAGDGYAQWGPVTNSYSNFTCAVQCRNTVSSCPFLLCELYHTNTNTTNSTNPNATTAINEAVTEGNTSGAAPQQIRAQA